MSGDSSSETTLLSAVVDSWYATESSGQTFPIIGSSSHFSWRVRSGLIRVQLSPRASERYTTVLPRTPGAIHEIAPPVHPAGGMGADDVRRAPVGTIRICTAAPAGASLAA